MSFHQSEESRLANSNLVSGDLAAEPRSSSSSLARNVQITGSPTLARSPLRDRLVEERGLHKAADR
jgi:hypothetical protein